MGLKSLFVFNNVDIFCYKRKFLIYNLVVRNLKLKYRKSYLGILWTVMAPIFSALVYFVIFKFILKVQVPNYVVFILSGILPWTFYSATLMVGMESLSSNHNLINKVPIPIHSFPLAEVVTLFINYLISIPVLLAITLITRSDINLSLLTVPFVIGILFLQTYSTTLLLSIAFVYFRDLRHLLNILMQILFYTNPIMYSTDMIPEQYRPLLRFHPTAYIFEALHQSFAYGKFLAWDQYATMTIWTLLIFFAALLVYRQFYPKISESL